MTLVCVAGEYLTGGATPLWAANGGWTASSLAAVIGVDAARRRSHEERFAWVLLLAGSVAWLAGQLCWDVYGATSYPSSPNEADICWLFFAVASAAGVHRLCRSASRSLKISLLEVTPLIVAVAALVVALLTNDLRASQLSAAGQANALAYPIFYASASLVIWQALLAGAMDVRGNPGIMVMLGGLALNAAGFVLWSPSLLAGNYTVGTGAVDALWSLGMIMLGGGAWMSRPVRALPEADLVSQRRGGVLPALTFVALVGGQLAINSRDGVPGLALTLGLGIVGMTLVVHAAVLRRRQATLLAQLRERENQLEDANATLSRESRRDALTGLGNRLLMHEDLDELAARTERYGHGYSIVLIDLDRFKAYNDNHGHQAGDLVLAQTGELVKETVREGERAYRYGGEEMLLVLPDQDLDGARALAERQRAQLEAAALPHAANSPHGVITLSAGIAAARAGETPQQTLHRADIALYEAKARGRNRIALSPTERTDTADPYRLSAAREPVS